MPANYDMVISQSPPVFSHSPPTGFLSEYGSNFRRAYEPPKGLYRPQMLVTSQLNKKPSFLSIKMAETPKRSCLITHSKTDLDATSDSESPDTLKSRTKKKVMFADDRGLELTQVKIMSEPSNVPPYWTLQFLAHVTQGLISPVPPEQWIIDFRQPASDYLDFRRKLDEKNVSLENVIVKENDSIVVGTVKVRNLSFSKEVIVRATWDNWKSQEDIYCVYSKIGGASGAYVLYDTFSFKFTLPPSSKKLEFCVCFRCDGVEYWDNNDGKNYTLSKRMSTGQERDGILTYDNNSNKLNGNNNSNNHNNNNTCVVTLNSKCGDDEKIHSWSNLKSWNKPENNCPYW